MQSLIPHEAKVRFLHASFPLGASPTGVAKRGEGDSIVLPLSPSPMHRVDCDGFMVNEVS